MLQSLVKKNLYKDSVALMRVAEALQSLPGVKRATLMMATPANLDILDEANLLPAGAREAKPGDLVIAVDAAGEAEARAAIVEAEARLAGSGHSAGQGDSARIAPRSVGMALAELPAARLAQISVPGPYAAAEALKALKRGLDVFMFSDNVPLAEERAIKQHAERAGRLVMGPDCGTAIIGGVPLGFANAVRRGRIGAVAASGTGLQEITCQIHRLGEGISHALGTGGRDLHVGIGGISMRQGLVQLAADPGTEVIVIVSKPPAPEVAAGVLAVAEKTGKPAVVLFLGASDVPKRASLHPVSTLQQAAAAAVALARGQTVPAASGSAGEAALAQAAARAKNLAPGQRWLRGLYSGGTFCTEAQLVLSDAGIACWSNVPVDKKRLLADPRVSREHTVVDLGSDEFTVGRPHPMIDFGSRVERLLAEAEDPTVAVILLDVVLGWGTHADPAGALAPALSEARVRAKRCGATPLFAGFVCGTEEDAQSLSRQRQALAGLGVLLADSSAGAASVAAAVLRALPA